MGSDQRGDPRNAATAGDDRTRAGQRPQSRDAMAAEAPLRSAGPQSHWIDIDGPLHYVDFGGPEGGTPMVLVHGLMGGHENWLALAPELTDDFRVIALDLVGHGRTQSAGRGTDVHTNQQVLSRFLARVVGEPVVLVGNSMGGMVSILQASEEPETVRGLVLLAPALPAGLTELPSATVMLNYLPFALRGLGPLLAATNPNRSPEEAVRWLLAMATADPDSVSESVVREHAQMAQERLQMPETYVGYPVAALSTILMMLQLRDYAATISAIEAPVLLIQGQEDRIVPPAGARKVAETNPHWQFESLPGVGHVPMIEVPQQVAGSVKAWAEQLPAGPTIEVPRKLGDPRDVPAGG